MRCDRTFADKIMKSIWHGLVLVVGLSLFCHGCNIRVQHLPDAVQDTMPKYVDFVATHSFPYIAPSQRQSILRRNYARLSAGLTKQEVFKILGEPDYSRSHYTKRSPPRYIGSGWKYFFEKPDPLLVNVKKDKQIQVFFDIKGKTHWIVSNAEGLNEIGEPSQQ